MTKSDSTAAPNPGVPKHERHFYGLNKAIGRFGMRVFTPYVMDQPHWHGHIEVNFLTGGSMLYDVNGEKIHIAGGELVLFWAGIPHQLIDIQPNGNGPPRLTNIYLPVDTFLFMPHIAQIQVALLGGALISLPPSLCSAEQLGLWYRDYRSNDFERIEVMKMELNAVLRRALTQDLSYLRQPLAEVEEGRTLSSAHIRHVVEMVRFILENLSEPITNADVAEVTGLHQNYALSLFSKTMRLPMKKFVIRMRLLRARALLMESALAIGKVAETCGFQSLSQFYSHFKSAYGMSPHAMRTLYTQMELR
ncbi:helix-turn-helix domain-containing protein [Flavimaricola marinus]|uniref:Melibiose operon regulatory protein n=1 Tax=Flavimaricola marinus TaxID=1819565 RepID=A0A238LCN6_9RHOB|nr:helix-turn-helix domain-containing protein [Flavimaricola marinus]SMY06680.1 Melibiose operon regulatory protein [Flavimaricola marinus]